MRELVLTGCKDFWPKDEGSALFLGPWCFSYNHKYKFWDQKNFRLAPSPWNGKKDILDSYLYISSLCDRITPRLSDIMNRLHSIDRSERFWKVYLTVWLMRWLSNSYNRFRRLENLENLKEKMTVKIISPKTDADKDFRNFWQFDIQSHHYNLSLMSDIIRIAEFDFLFCEEIEKPIGEIGRGESLMSRPRGMINQIMGFFRRSKIFINDYLSGVSLLGSDAYLGSIYGMSSFTKLWLQFSSKPGLKFVKRKDNKLKALKCRRDDLAKYHLDFGAKNKFERIVESILLDHMPDDILTIYENDDKFQSNIKTWIGNDIFISAKSAFRIADIVENGGRWISVQHGGGYGQLLSIANSKIEYEIGDGFVTWGWKDKPLHLTRFCPMPSPLLSNLKTNKETETSLVFVGTAPPAYPGQFSSYFLPEQIIDYFDNKLTFLKTLKKSIISHVKYRPYFEDFGIGEKEYVSRIIPSSQLLTGVKLTSVFSRSRLVVIDHLTTSFLEALTINVPTILFCDPAHFIFSDSAAPFFENLRRAGVLYDDPVSAANKVNEVWADPQSWWTGPDIQIARRVFCSQFACSSRNWRKEWLEFLKTQQNKR